MNANGLEPRYDADIGIWEIGVIPPGPAGAARLVLSDGLELMVDVAEPTQLGVVLFEDEFTGHVRDADLVAAATFLGRARVEMVAGGRDLPDAEPEQAALGTLVALAVDRLDLARSDGQRNLWAGELASLAGRADPRTQLSHAIDPYRSAARDGTHELTRLEAARTGSAGRRAPDLDQIEVARPRLTPGADGRSLDGTVVLDAALAPRHVLDLGRPTDLRWDRIDQTLQVSCPVASRAYLPEVGIQWVRVYQPDSRVMLALGSLDPGASTAGSAGVDLLLGPLDDNAVRTLAIDVTPDPATRPPSESRRGSDAASRFGRAAVTAERLGLADAADDAWRRCAATWASIGDNTRAGQAEANAAAVAARTARAQEPFVVEVLTAEIDDLA